MASAKDLRIIYMGTPDFAVLPLKILVEKQYNIAAVITAPDKPAGRGLKVQESAVKKYAVKKGLNILQPEKLKDPAFLQNIKNLEPDLGIVIAFRMLPEILWSMPKLGTFNLHASLLPEYRGAAPINWAIINGEEKTGITTFMLNNKIDEGDIIFQKEIPINYFDNAGTLHDKLMEIGTEAVVETVNIINSGQLKSISQSDVEDRIKPAPKIFKDTCRINWNIKAEDIRNHIRGLSPYPGAWTELDDLDGKTQFKIFAADVLYEDNSDGTIGEILTDGKKILKVRCKNGYISIKQLQLAGKKRMDIDEFLCGYKHAEHNKFIY